MDVADETVGQRVDHVGEALGTLFEEAQAAAAELAEVLALRARVRERPVVTLLGAAAVGYVIAGGLFTPLTARLLRGGMRLAALPLVRDELLGLLEGLRAPAAVSKAAEPPPGAH